MPTLPASHLFMVVKLGSEQGLTKDADDDFLPVLGHLAKFTRLAHSPEHADQRIDKVLRIPIGPSTVSAMPLTYLGLFWILRSRSQIN
jgi:hypothetical protein